MATLPNSITTLPDAPVLGVDTQQTWATKAAARLTAESAMVPELNSANATTYSNAVEAFNKAAEAGNSAANALVSAQNAAASSGAVLWVSGTTYALGFVVSSPINGAVYRRIVAGAGTVDPSLDTVNWQPRMLNFSTGHATIMPTLNQDFSNSKRIDPRFSFTRSSTKAYFDAFGVRKLAEVNEPCFTHDPATGEVLGISIDKTSTNLLLNSLIDGSNLATQSVTVTAQNYTLSFYGTGNIALSGAHSATLTGTGSMQRVTVTFTPSAGSLTLTVTGEVKWAQLETGVCVTSHIPTAGTSVTRNADLLVDTTIGDWYRQDEGTFIVEFARVVYTVGGVEPNVFTLAVSDNSTSNLLSILSGSSIPAQQRFDVTSAGVPQAQLLVTASLSSNTSHIEVAAYKLNDVAAIISGGSIVTDSSAAIPATLSRCYIGASATGTVFGSQTIKRITYYPMRLTNEQLVAMSLN